jgi:hypothetical protein
MLADGGSNSGTTWLKCEVGGMSGAWLIEEKSDGIVVGNESKSSNAGTEFGETDVELGLLIWGISLFANGKAENGWSCMC